MPIRSYYMKRLSFVPKIMLPLMFLMGMFILSGCHEEAHHAESGSLSVTKPWRKTVEVTQNYVSQIKAIQHIEIRAMEKGFLQNIFVDEGQVLKKGDKIFQIMP